jgi:hypothetical protein
MVTMMIMIVVVTLMLLMMTIIEDDDNGDDAYYDYHHYHDDGDDAYYDYHHYHEECACTNLRNVDVESVCDVECQCQFLLCRRRQATRQPLQRLVVTAPSHS